MLPLRSMAKLVTLCVALALSSAALAQSYPSKPIRFIVPDGPGSVSDLRARQLGAKLSEQMRQPVVIDNRSGGSFIIGAEAAAKSPADGYTIFLGSIVTHSLNPLLFKSLPYRPNEDFVPVTLLSAGPMILVASPSVPATNLRQLIDLSKAKPNQLGYGVVGLGSPGHLVMEQIKRETGAKFLMVPYKSSGTYIQDLMGGHLPVTLSYWSIVGPAVNSGKLRALAVAAPHRLEAAPDVPTFADAGVPGIEGYGWQGIFVPAGTSPVLVARLQIEIASAINSPEIRGQMIDSGADPGGNTPEQFAAMIRADQAKWRRLAGQVDLAKQ